MKRRTQWIAIIIVPILAFLISCAAVTPLAITSSLPTYSEVVKTYPPGTDLCQVEVYIVDVKPEGYVFGGGSSWTEHGGKNLLKCYGSKVTLEVPVSLDGKTYKAGTKLTMDKNLNWIEVSSWD
jgi:hypothetical protein